MKSLDIIRAALADWRPIADAPELADSTFHDLDDEEIGRLALRAFTEEIRKELRRKISGVPVYTSVITADEDGERRRVYKQTALFEVADYRVAIDFYLRESEANRRVAKALAADCQRRLGIQLQIPGLAA